MKPLFVIKKIHNIRSHSISFKHSLLFLFSYTNTKFYYFYFEYVFQNKNEHELLPL